MRFLSVSTVYLSVPVLLLHAQYHLAGAIIVHGAVGAIARMGTFVPSSFRPSFPRPIPNAAHM